MLLTITTTYRPATDLGYLLHKNPARLQVFPLSFGSAIVCYPEATEERCTAALLLDVDPIGLVRRKSTSVPSSAVLEQYVNDRPYVASSYLSVAIASVFGSALTGRSTERPELAQQPIPLEAAVVVLPCRGGESLLRRLFEPLGYEVEFYQHPLDPKFPEWGQSRYFTVHLRGTCRLSDLLSHLYVLVPVLDDEKHYWVGDEEVGKLLRVGEGWLPDHPERELIAHRYLKHQRSLIRQALAQLLETSPGYADEAEPRHMSEEELERPIRLSEQRVQAVVALLRDAGVRRVLDLGCGEGRLLQELLKEPVFQELVGVEVTHRSLELAQQRLQLEKLPSWQRQRIKLLHSSLTYRDKRLAGYDAAVLMEVIEHLDPWRLAAFEEALFGFTRPAMVIITTPNAEYNVLFKGLPAGAFRHKDHRFEWTRRQFQTWASGVAERHGYQIRFLSVGPEDPSIGSPTQMGVFTR